MASEHAASRASETAGDEARGRCRRLFYRLREPRFRSSDSQSRAPAVSPGGHGRSLGARRLAAVDFRTTSLGIAASSFWHSKGYGEGNSVMANRVAEAMWRWSDAGRLPIVCDACRLLARPDQ